MRRPPDRATAWRKAMAGSLTTSGVALETSVRRPATPSGGSAPTTRGEPMWLVILLLLLLALPLGGIGLFVEALR